MLRGSGRRSIVAAPQPQPLLPIGGAAQPAPILMSDVTVDRRCEPALEIVAGAPAGLALELARVDGIARVMPRPVGDEGDEPFMRRTRRMAAVEQRADGAHDINVPPLGPGADQISLARLARHDDTAQRGH